MTCAHSPLHSSERTRSEETGCVAVRVSGGQFLRKNWCRFRRVTSNPRFVTSGLSASHRSTRVRTLNPAGRARRRRSRNGALTSAPLRAAAGGGAARRRRGRGGSPAPARPEQARQSASRYAPAVDCRVGARSRRSHGRRAAARAAAAAACSERVVQQQRDGQQPCTVSIVVPAAAVCSSGDRVHVARCSRGAAIGPQSRHGGSRAGAAVSACPRLAACMPRRAGTTRRYGVRSCSPVSGANW